MTYRPALNFDGSIAHLWQGDSLDFLRSLPDESVDMMVSSPPYCVGKEYDRHTSLEGFESEIIRLTDEIVRVLRVGGNLCWQTGFHVSNGAVFPLDASIVNIYRAQADLVLRNRIVWTFGHGFHATKRFSGRHETVLWYSKGESSNFDLDKVRVPQKYPGKRYYKGPKKGEYSGNPLGKNPGDVWEIPNVKAKHIEKTAHPCQFPVALANRLILSLSPIGGTIVDPFFGSGTTAFSALLNGRNFFGSDISESYVDIAVERLQHLQEGKGVYREDAPIRTPRPGEAVSQRPEHFVF